MQFYFQCKIEPPVFGRTQFRLLSANKFTPKGILATMGLNVSQIRFIYTEQKANLYLWSLSLYNVNTKLDSLWTHLEAISLSRQYKWTHTVQRRWLLQSGSVVFHSITIKRIYLIVLLALSILIFTPPSFLLSILAPITLLVLLWFSTGWPTSWSATTWPWPPAPGWPWSSSPWWTWPFPWSRSRSASATKVENTIWTWKQKQYHWKTKTNFFQCQSIWCNASKFHLFFLEMSLLKIILQ